MEFALGKLRQRRPRLVALALLIVVAAACVACSRNPQDDATPTGQTQLPPAFSTVTLTPEPTATATPSPTPTPILPRVVMDDQVLDDGGELVARSVALPQDGWLVIYRSLDGRPDEVIGRTPLAAGVHENVAVAVDAMEATDELYAGLYMDGGRAGVFEYPGDDAPFPGEPRVTLNVELRVPQPSVVVSDQAVADNGLVTVDQATVLVPSWLVIHADDDGTPGDVVGRILLEPGEHEGLQLPIHWRAGTPRLHAVLYGDSGQSGQLELPDVDLPLLFSGRPVATTFNATFPPDIVVYDQPVVDGVVVVDRVISDGPGWLAVYYDDEGQPGLIIGSAPLEDGLNRDIPINLIRSAVTPLLYVRLHADTEPGDPFDFPREDPIVMSGGRMPPATPFRTDLGAQLIVRDQALTADGNAVVDLVVTPADAWVVIHADEDGQPGEVLGSARVPAGVSRSVAVPLDPLPTGSAIAVLYRDLGERDSFESPEVDPLLTNDDNTPIRVPFAVQ